MDQIPFLNPEATKRHNALPDHHIIPYQCDIFIINASLCLSFPVLAGPLACAIRGLIQICEAQVWLGCTLLPTGIRRWRVLPRLLVTSTQRARAHTDVSISENMHSV